MLCRRRSRGGAASYPGGRRVASVAQPGPKRSRGRWAATAPACGNPHHLLPGPRKRRRQSLRMAWPRGCGPGMPRFTPHWPAGWASPRSAEPYGWSARPCAATAPPPPQPADPRYPAHPPGSARPAPGLPAAPTMGRRNLQHNARHGELRERGFRSSQRTLRKFTAVNRPAAPRQRCPGGATGDLPRKVAS
jgi:hypothetical protein